jgi:hypothetical protein
VHGRAPFATPRPAPIPLYAPPCIQHPDKNKDEGATRTFQALGVVHATLSDPDKRRVYDDTGVIDDTGDSEKEWCVAVAPPPPAPFAPGHLPPRAVLL